MISGLGARVHLLLRPELREGFTALFRDLLECNVRELDFGLPYPILLVSLADGSAFSVEFSGNVPENAFCGTWIEFRTGDVAAVQKRLDDAGIESFSHPGSPHRYFAAPGGQVFRILDLHYRGP